MLRVLLFQISFSIFCLLYISIPIAQAAGQLDFVRKTGASRIVLSYRLQALDQSVYELTLPLDRTAVDRAKEQFKPVNTQRLRKEARAERMRQTVLALDELKVDFPQVEFQLADSNIIRWSVSIPDDYQAEREAFFNQIMLDEIGEILRRFPKSDIRSTKQGHYEISAVSKTELENINQDLEVAMQRSQQVVRQRDEIQQQQVQVISGEVRKRLMAEVDLVSQRMEDFELRYYKDRWYQEYQGNSLLPDYARIANASLADLQPVVLRLRPWLSGLSRREAINRLLLLVQSIPYDRLDSRVTDAGFLMPLSVLAQNRGDCDSKSVLFAALLRKLYPGMPVSLVLLKQHALLAVGIKAQRDDVVIHHAHRDWVLAEPVGPAVLPLGQVGEQYRSNLNNIEGFMRLF